MEKEKKLPACPLKASRLAAEILLYALPADHLSTERQIIKRLSEQCANPEEAFRFYLAEEWLKKCCSLTNTYAYDSICYLKYIR